MVSKDFQNIIDAAPAWERAWSALKVLRSKNLVFAARPGAWNYIENRPRTKAESKVHQKEMAQINKMYDGSPHAENVIARHKYPQNWGMVPIEEPGVTMQEFPWRWRGTGVREESERSNAISASASSEANARALLGRSQEALYLNPC